VQSSALLPLVGAGGAPALGVIAVGSRDPNRFYPGMGTLFLRMMGVALTVALPGGTLRIGWRDDASPITMAGPAAFVYEGEFDLGNLA
jgi:hypothetical protein